MIVKNDLPMSFVESESFRAYSASLNAEYIIPSRKTVSDLLIPAKVCDFFVSNKKKFLLHLNFLSK